MSKHIIFFICLMLIFIIFKKIKEVFLLRKLSKSTHEIRDELKRIYKDRSNIEDVIAVQQKYDELSEIIIKATSLGVEKSIKRADVLLKELKWQGRFQSYNVH